MKIAVIIPCLNEESSIAKVVAECHKHLPSGMVYVFDNGSTDLTSELARKAGAHVIHSPLRGKGHVLRHAFRALDADYFVMIDGDGTYPVSEAARLIAFAQEYNYEMVMGARLELGRSEAFRPLHYLGNRFFSGLVRLLFNYPVNDLLTGYRVFSRRFVQHMPLVSRGFEVETELTIRALAQDLPFAEVSIPYAERPPGGKSKLRTFRDGWLILRTIVRLWKSFRPMRFFSTFAALLLGTALTGPPSSAFAFANAAVLFFALGYYLDARLDFEKFRLREQSNATPTRETLRAQERRSA